MHSAMHCAIMKCKGCANKTSPLATNHSLGLYFPGIYGRHRHSPFGVPTIRTEYGGRFYILLYNSRNTWFWGCLTNIFVLRSLMVTEGKLRGLNESAEWKKSRGTPSPWTTRKSSLLEMEHEATIELDMIGNNMSLLHFLRLSTFFEVIFIFWGHLHFWGHLNFLRLSSFLRSAEFFKVVFILLGHLDFFRLS